jgi:DNA-binding protein H-NS
MIAFARDGIGKYRPFGSPEWLPEGLSAEQGAAAAHVLQSRDRVTAIRGAAGTGKTYLMKSTIAAIEHSRPGRKVHVLAPSAQASRGVLRGELLITRDRERKEKATEEAKALLARVGLIFRDVVSKAKPARNGKPPAYRAGQRYQHPTQKDLVWNGTGVRPKWVRELEANGKGPVEIEAESAKNGSVADSKERDNRPSIP